jgi:hypothetical protein
VHRKDEKPIYDSALDGSQHDRQLPRQEINDMVIKRVGPVSCAKIAGALYAIMGFFAGAFISLLAMAGTFASQDTQMPFAGALFGVGAIVLLPVFYGCLGFVATLIMAWIYNILASALGGVEIDVQ